MSHLPQLSTGLTQETVDVRLTWTDCDVAGDNVVPNVLSQRDIVSRPDNINETVLHTYFRKDFQMLFAVKEAEISPPHRALGQI